MKANCLTRALDQWDEDKNMRLWYNSNHVIAIEERYDIGWAEMPASGQQYLPVSLYGTQYFLDAFELSKKHVKLLGEYFNSLCPNINIQ